MRLPKIPTAGGTASGVPTLDAVPEWALATTRNEGTDAIGIGSGPTLERATTYALQDVASRLSVSIESELRDVQQQTGQSNAESFEQIIETRVTGTRFTGWERTRSVKTGSEFWVEVRIDRDRLIRDSQSELVEIGNQVDAQLEAAKGSSLRRLVALQTTATQRQRAGTLIMMIDAMDPEFDRSGWEARRANWRRADENARRALIFEVRADADSREVARWLESELASEQLEIRKGGCMSSDAICIDIRSEVSEATVASRYVTKIRSFFAVREPGGGVFQERDLTGRGDSTSGAGRARREALDDLHNRLTSTDVIDKLLIP